MEMKDCPLQLFNASAPKFASTQQIAVTIVCQSQATTQDFRCSVEFQSVFNQLAAFRDGYALHSTLDPRNKGRRRAELIHAEAQQKRNQRNVARHFSANTHPNATGMRRVGNHLEQTQYRRMRWLI